MLVSGRFGSVRSLGTFGGSGLVFVICERSGPVLLSRVPFGRCMALGRMGKLRFSRSYVDRA